MISRCVARLRAESGFGLVELIVAITVLNVGIFAALSAFSSGYVAINRTKAIASGSALLDTQMERFRALTFASICLSTTSSNTAYTGNAPTGTAVPTCSTTDPALVPLRDPVTGPDGRSYRVDTYVYWQCVNGTLSTTSPNSTASPACSVAAGSPGSAPTKLVRITVRDHTSTGKVYAQAESTFDQSTGL
jgi:Tfp pilus assembly protein PilV